MGDRFVMSVRQGAELDHALERNGCDSAFVKWLSVGSTLAQFHQVYENKAEIVKKRGDSPRKGKGLSSLKEKFDPFLKRTFKIWRYNQADIDRFEGKPHFVNLHRFDFEKEVPADSARFGEYTLNPEMKKVDLENIPTEKIKIISIPEMVGEPIWRVAKYVVEKYGKTHKVPGVETWQFILEDLETKSQDVREKYKSLRNGNHHFLFGSLVRHSDGYTYVPCVRWVGSKWNRHANWLVYDWNSFCRVVLLEI